MVATGEDVLQTAQQLTDQGDLAGALRSLRSVEDDSPPLRLAELVQQIAVAGQLDELAAAAGAVVEDPRDPKALFDLAYACVGHKMPYLAVPPLRALLDHLERIGVDPPAVVIEELATAYEDCERYYDAARIMERHAPRLGPWPAGYLLAFYTLMAGNARSAIAYSEILPKPEDRQWSLAWGRTMLRMQRAQLLLETGRLDPRDLRGWHLVINGTILGQLSPFGYDRGMNGRYAFVQSHWGDCRFGLERLGRVLAAAERRPEAVALLPDRPSQILGRAAGAVLGLPTRPYEPGNDTGPAVIVAYDLDTLDVDTTKALMARGTGEVLAVHSTCWTDPPLLSPDYTLLQYQMAVTPWGGRLTGRYQESPDDDRRPVNELAEQIVTADPAQPEPDPAEGIPADSDQDLDTFTSLVQALWPSGDNRRDRTWSPGPVRTTRFL